ncbi:MAG: hypothetical protein IIW08_09500 [Clostridia bacterium]|nr:hypothetical protein [Clostridia bacterium]MBQ2434300.1 hypothetical protein [Clostridia bacterium]MBQ5771395.1 hypothetical protein [Clostridia bacterium]
MIMEFLNTYGVLLTCAAAILALSCALIVCVIKVKRLEQAVYALKNAILDRMDQHDKAVVEEQKKERRLLNESMSNLSESVTRAVFSIKAESKKGE